MTKKTFEDKLNEYIKFFETNSSAFNNNLKNLITNSLKIFNMLQMAFEKENSTENILFFKKHIAIIKNKLNNKKYFNSQEIINDILLELNFVKTKYCCQKVD